jgi:uncharacterized protein (DUF2267 family)
VNTSIRPILHLKHEHTPRHTFYLKRRSRRSSAVRSDDFVRRVTALVPRRDRVQARTAIHATLETLGQYLSPPQARRMTARLSRELAETMGRLAGQGGPETIDGFYAQVAARANLAHEDAVVYARAVTGALRQTVPEGELADALLKLPREFDELVA